MHGIAGTITTSSGYSSAAGLRHHLLDDSLLDATADTSDAGGVCQLMFNTKTVNWRAGGDKYGIDNPVLAGQQRWSLIDRRASTLPAGVAASGSCDDISGILGDLSLSPTNTTDMSNVSAVMGGADGADISLIKVQCTMHGAVRRRTTLKHGRKPTVWELCISAHMFWNSWAHGRVITLPCTTQRCAIFHRDRCQLETLMLEPL
jgi:hypothetical protein